MPARRLPLFAASLALLLFAAAGPADSQERRFRSPANPQAKEQRFALVVGNRAYPQGALVTPENDANDVAASLRKLGFEVVLATNLDPTRFRSTIRKFEDLLAGADGRLIAVVFYAGHGVQIQGKNYLLPAQVQYKDQRDVLDFGIEADQLLARINAQEPEVTIMILDACRDSPLPPVARSTRGDSGLARMDPPAGSLLAFATSPGSTASDNQRERNGLFTKFLLQHIATPGLTAEQLFRRVRTDVYRASRGQQLPEDSNRLVGGDFFFSLTASAAPAVPVAAVPARGAPPAKALPASPESVKPAPDPRVALATPAPASPVIAAPAPEALAGLALPNVLRSGERSIVYSYRSAIGTAAEFEARAGARSEAFLEMPDGGVLTPEGSLWIHSGLQFEPPIPIAKPDLAPGARWSHSGKYREVTGTASGIVDSSFQVLAREELATAAGRFQTLRVREIRWIAGTRYEIERWHEAETLLPLRETNATRAAPNNPGSGGYFIAPTLKSSHEIKSFALRPR